MEFWSKEKKEKKYATRLFCTAFHTPSKYIIDLNFIFCSLLCPALTSFDRHFIFFCSDGNMLCSSAIEKAGDQQIKQKERQPFQTQNDRKKLYVIESISKLK